jgi:tetratricopeptide (TPR) repeat protein
MENTIKTMAKHPQTPKIMEIIGRSISLRQAKRHEEALECLEEAIGIDPKFFPVLVEKGTVLLELARYEEAIECFDRFLKYINNAQVRELRDNCLKLALASYELILAQNGSDVEVILKKGDILQRLHRNDDAVNAYDAAIQIYVENIANVMNRKGNSLLYLLKPEAALESYNCALQMSPHNAAFLFNRGNVLQKLARMEEAIESYDLALKWAPGLAEAKMERSQCRLAQGDFKQGFQEYESRWETVQLKDARLRSPNPLWLGKENLAGKTILLWAEQGYGDSIQFLRYVPLVAQIAGKTILRVPPLLQALAESLDRRVSIINSEDDLPPHDFNCPLMSLPLAFGTTLESIPTNTPYLSAGTDQVKKWQDRLGPRKRPRIGLAWAGRRREPVNHTRDMGLEVFLPLVSFDIDIISLQKEIPDQDRPVLASMRQLIRVGEELSDFADTAALLKNLDLVITVDTVVAHLAGALGKPVWIMLRNYGEWRWLLRRSDSLWYPTARIFRQKTPGDWAGVVSDMVQQLDALLSNSLH